MANNIRETKRTAAIMLVGALFVMATGAAGSGCGSSGSAATPQERIAAQGIDTATDTGAPCADLGCNSGDVCDCITGSGASFAHSGSLSVASITYELSVDKSSPMNAGNPGGKCMPSTGNGVLTLEDQSTIDFVISGLDCTRPGIGYRAFSGTMLLDGGTAEGGQISGVGSMRTASLGQNTSAIAVTEIQYQEMWAQDVTAMYGYHASGGGS